MSKPPVIYSILVMRDDDRVTSFRMRAMWIKLGIAAVVMLVLLCAGAGVGGYQLFAHYRAAVKERDNLEIALSESMGQVERFKSQQMASNIQVKSSMTPINKIVQPQQAPQERGDVASAVHPAATDEELARILQEEPAAPAGAEENRAAEQHQIIVNNFKLTQNAEGVLRAAFEISNRLPGKSITGECFLALLDADGKEHPVKLNTGLLKFQISRYRKMDASFALPQGVEAAQVKAVRLTAKADNLPLYSRDFNVTLR